MLAVALELLLDLSTHALLVQGRASAPPALGDGADAPATSDALPDEVACCGASLAAAALGAEGNAQVGVACTAAQVLAFLPGHIAPSSRLEALISSIRRHVGPDGQPAIASRALSMLPLFMSQLVRAASKGEDACWSCCADLISQLLKDGQAAHVADVGVCVGRLACLRAGSGRVHTWPCRGEGATWQTPAVHIEELVCPHCDEIPPSGPRTRAESAIQINPARPAAPAPSRAGAPLSALIRPAWELLARLPVAESKGRVALVGALSRLLRHAHPTELARNRDLMVHFVGLLADPAPDVSAACAEALPKLLGCPGFVRVVGGLSEHETIDSRTLQHKVSE